MKISTNNNNFSQISFGTTKQTLPRELILQANSISRILADINPKIESIQTSTQRGGVKIIRELITNSIFSNFENNGAKFCFDKKTVRVQVPNLYTLLIDAKDSVTNNTSSLILNGNRVEKMSGDFKDGAGKLVKEILDLLDNSVFNVRKILGKEKVRNFLDMIAPHGVLSGNNAELVDDIRNLYDRLIQEFAEVKNQESSARIKRYYKHAIPTKQGTKTLHFGNFDDGIEFKINRFFGKGEKNILISIIQNNEAKNYLIKENGEVGKIANWDTFKSSLNVRYYFSQKDLDSMTLTQNLQKLRKTLSEYKDDIIKRKESLVYTSWRQTATDTGHISAKDMKKMASLEAKLDEVWHNVLRLKTDKKSAYKRHNFIDTPTRIKGLLFKKLTKNEEDVYFGYGRVLDKTYKKLYILNPDRTVKRMYYIDGDKLVKFNTSSLNRNIHQKSQVLHYSQADVDSSGVDEYIELLNKRLETIRAYNTSDVCKI